MFRIKLTSGLFLSIKITLNLNINKTATRKFRSLFYKCYYLVYISYPIMAPHLSQNNNEVTLTF